MSVGAFAMALAAGRGRRMGSESDRRPKPLTVVDGRTLLDRALDSLVGAGAETIVVNVHHLADQIEAAVAARRDAGYRISDERDQLLETGGGVRKALPLLGEDAFFVRNTDTFWMEGRRRNLERLKTHWDEDRMDALLLVAPMVLSSGVEGRGDFHMDQAGRLTRRGAGEVAPFVYTGAQLVHPRLFKDAPNGPFSFNLLWDRALASGRLFGSRLDGLFIHVGAPEALAEAEQVVSGARTPGALA